MPQSACQGVSAAINVDNGFEKNYLAVVALDAGEHCEERIRQ
jgi:hypothetical protein